MNRLKRLLLLVLASCSTLALLRWLNGSPPLPLSLSRLAAAAVSSVSGGQCDFLSSLGDLAEWVARDNETAVCRDAGGRPLYQRLPAASGGGGYPLCRLARPPPWLERRIRAGSVTTWIAAGEEGGVRRVPVIGYTNEDLITRSLASRHSWEEKLVRPLLARLRRLGRGNATLLDVGCNIGVYTLQAAALGFPVVAVDANARNLARVSLALREPALAASGAEARVDLVWNFIAAAKTLARLNYPADCNIGGATKFLRDVADPVPVMPIGGDALAGLLRTPLVVMKLDAEGGEADFLRTGRALFANRTVAAVQMEWLSNHHTGTDARDIIKFFDCRDYSLHTVDGKRRLDISRPRIWPTEILWLHKSYSWLL